MAATSPVFSQTIYKIIGKDGKVTYSSEPPPGDAKATKVDIAPGNTAVAPKAGPREETEYEKVIRRKPAPSGNDGAVRQARDRLEAARKALENARESVDPEDWTYTNRPGVGPRRFPRPDYTARLERLEADVKSAEEAVAEAERGR
jgi:hypothetical protein